MGKTTLSCRARQCPRASVPGGTRALRSVTRLPCGSRDHWDPRVCSATSSGVPMAILVGVINPRGCLREGRAATLCRRSLPCRGSRALAAKTEGEGWGPSLHSTVWRAQLPGCHLRVARAAAPVSSSNSFLWARGALSWPHSPAPSGGCYSGSPARAGYKQGRGRVEAPEWVVMPQGLEASRVWSPSSPGPACRCERLLHPITAKNPHYTWVLVHAPCCLSARHLLGGVGAPAGGLARPYSLSPSFLSLSSSSLFVWGPPLCLSWSCLEPPAGAPHFLWSHAA